MKCIYIAAQHYNHQSKKASYDLRTKYTNIDLSYFISSEQKNQFNYKKALLPSGTESFMKKQQAIYSNPFQFV